MTTAYVDTSYLVAIAFGEAKSAEHARRLAGFRELIAANLLEAELRSAYRREGIDSHPESLQLISWISPNRPLSNEIARVLAHGYLRGADLWHLAAAVYAAGDPGRLTFLTLDNTQLSIAKALGFRM